MLYSFLRLSPLEGSSGLTPGGTSVRREDLPRFATLSFLASIGAGVVNQQLYKRPSS